MNNQNSNQWDLNPFLDELIEEMGLQNSPAEKLESLKGKMAFALNDAVSNAVMTHVDPEVIEEVMTRHNEKTDVVLILKEIMEKSPHMEEVLVATLRKFKENTLDAFNHLKK